MRAIALSLTLAAPLLAADPPPPSGDTIVSPDARLEKVFTRSRDATGGLTEGPAVAPDGSIYFSDIAMGEDKGQILRYDPASGATSVFVEDSLKSNGLIFDANGFLLACHGSDHGARAVSRYNVENASRTVVADRFLGKRFNAPNDLVVDRLGRIYFTDPRYLGAEPRELRHRAVYRVDTDGAVMEVTHDISKPNGIALSPGGKTLYVAEHDNGSERIDDPDAPPGEHGDMRIYAWPLDEDGLVAGPRKTFHDFGHEAGCDGMTVDAEGNLYLTARGLSRPGVLVLNPKGEEIAFIPTGPRNQSTDLTPMGLPSNVEFGIGNESKTLYVTVDVSLYRIKLKVDGYHAQYSE